VVLPGYATAEPTKAYTLTMLFARLTVGIVCTASAGAAAAFAAKRNPRAALWVGLAALAVSTPVHLFEVWADYPAWYHFVYLGYLVPVATVAGRLVAGLPKTS
jgi:hypothetical protein